MEAEVICAWCRDSLGTKDVVVPAGMPAVTHGICKGCKAELEADSNGSKNVELEED